MNSLTTGIDAQSQIVPGENPETLERLTGEYYDRFVPQGPEECALIDSAIASDWLLRRLRKTECEVWTRSMTRKVDDQRKWGEKPETYTHAAAFMEQAKVFERLQRRISATERALRASLESLARLRKQSGTCLPACLDPVPGDVGQALPPGNTPDAAMEPPPIDAAPDAATPSKHTPIIEIGFRSENHPDPAVPPAAGIEPPEPATEVSTPLDR
jgi:hypothetical protein